MTKENLEKAGYPHDFVAADRISLTVRCGDPFTILGWSELLTDQDKSLVRGKTLSCYASNQARQYVWMGPTVKSPELYYSVWQLKVTTYVTSDNPSSGKVPMQFLALLPMEFLPHYAQLKAVLQGLELVSIKA